jgi:two-component system, OmpR family, sensor histidine kinase ChvG
MKTAQAVALIGAGILCFSLGALSIIVAAVMILIVSQVAAGLIDARAQTLLTQGEVIAMAIASQGTESDAINIDPEQLLELQTGKTYSPSDDTFGFEFPVNPERVAPLVRLLITPTNTRARIYDRDGTLILDSRNLYGRGDVLRFDLPPLEVAPLGIVERTFTSVHNLLLGRRDLPPYREIGPENGRGYAEVTQALGGQKASVVRANDRGEALILVAVPIQRLRTVRGALLLSTPLTQNEMTITSVLKVSIYVLAIVLLFAAVFASIVRSRTARTAAAS